ncbi:hypothetical protein [uncultured Friedmanniella sp.]|uniref:hypothetical protein n=1 Tax=uncultured Friedmanniella sp. TaxID=335381 RepID=UPI0035CBB34C
MPHRTGRWTQLLLARLELEPAVGVKRALEEQLGRPPTTAELSAVRRAAHHLADEGKAELHRVPVAVPHNRGTSSYLVVARPGVELSQSELADAIVVLPHRARGDDREAVERLVRLVGRGAATAEQVLVEAVDPKAAGVLAEELGRSVAELNRLRRQLVRRSAVPVRSQRKKQLRSSRGKLAHLADTLGTVDIAEVRAELTRQADRSLDEQEW